MIAPSPTSPPSRETGSRNSRAASPLVRVGEKEGDQGPRQHLARKFVESVRTAKEYIAAGDVFQVVLSQRLDFKPPAEPFQIYRALRTVNPSPYMFFLKLDDLHVVGASPEMLVRVSGRKLEYRPIAGTRKRGADPAEDERLTAELRNDEKERAEHVMLVDLGRNDLGRVSEYGTVKVRDLMYVEKYSHVMHLVSALEGQSARRSRRARRAGGVLPRRHAERRAQGSRHGDHRGAGAGAPRRLWRVSSLCRSCGQSGFVHRHSDDGAASRIARTCRQALASSPTPIPKANIRSA